MKLKSTVPILLVLLTSIVFSTNVVFAQDDDDTDYDTIFSAERIDQWETTGMVVPDLTDGLTFVFPYNENAVLAGRVDTVAIRLIESIDLSRCSTAFIRYDKSVEYPQDESWILTDVEFYVKHEYSDDWVRVFENISELAGWVHQMEIQFKIAITTDRVYPATLKLSNFRVEGTCHS